MPENANNPRRIVHVIEDDEALLRSLCFSLKFKGYETRGYGSPGAALDVAPEAFADGGCLVVDVRFEGDKMDGLDLLEELAKKGVNLPAVVVSGHGTVQDTRRAFRSGAVDFLEKPYKVDDVVRAMEDGFARAAHVAPTVVPEALVFGAVERVAALTSRERNVLQGMVAGWANKQIGSELGISFRTVEVYRARVMSKLNAETSMEALRIAMAAGVPPLARQAISKKVGVSTSDKEPEEDEPEIAHPA